MTEQRRTYVLQCAAFFAFFIAWSSAFALFPIWLNQTLGHDGSDTGIIFSANAVAAFVVMPCYGYVQDRFGLRKHLLYLVAGGLMAAGPFMIWAYPWLLVQSLIGGAIVGGLFFAITFSAGVGALETYVERFGRHAGFEFGKARMWGSLGWATASFYAGALFNIAPEINFAITSAAGLVFLLLIAAVAPPASLPGSDAARDRVSLREALTLFGLARFWALAVYVMGVTCVYSVYDQQFPIYFASLFETRAAGNATFGYLNGLQVFLEAGGMFLAPMLVNRIGARNGLLVAGVVMAIRILGSGVADTPFEISAMKLLHAVELPIMLVSLFKYIAATFDARLSATLYLVGFQFMSQLAASVLSVAAGAMYDSWGYPSSYLVLGTIVASFTGISAILLTRDCRPSGNETVNLENEKGTIVQ